MSEVINWREMTTIQRDMLIAEKVMGITQFLCAGPLSYAGNNTLYGHHFYVCQECKVRLTITDYYLEGCKGKVPEQHAKPIPRYTTSMDAAWQVVQRFTVGVYLEYIPGRDCCCSNCGGNAPTRRIFSAARFA